MSLDTQIIEIIKKVTGASVSTEESLVDNNLLDSISVVDLTLELEEAFGIKIQTFEVKWENYESVKKIAEFVKGKNASL